MCTIFRARPDFYSSDWKNYFDHHFPTGVTLDVDDHDNRQPSGVDDAGPPRQDEQQGGGGRVGGGG